MKKSCIQVFKIAAKILNKYADGPAVQAHIQQSIANAASRPALGIMPFPQMLETDKASLKAIITKSGGNITVSGLDVQPKVFEPKYAALPAQIKSYLEKYIDLFPTGTNSISFEINYNQPTG